MQNKIFKALTSRTTWAIVAMFVTGGLNAVVGLLPADMATYLQGLLGFLAVYYKVNPSQDY